MPTPHNTTTALSLPLRDTPPDFRSFDVLLHVETDVRAIESHCIWRGERLGAGTRDVLGVRCEALHSVEVDAGGETFSSAQLAELMRAASHYALNESADQLNN
jgi:hypothetical protein